jgi:hypothetical protein
VWLACRGIQRQAELAGSAAAISGEQITTEMTVRTVSLGRREQTGLVEIAEQEVHSLLVRSCDREMAESTLLGEQRGTANCRHKL